MHIRFLIPVLFALGGVSIGATTLPAQERGGYGSSAGAAEISSRPFDGSIASENPQPGVLALSLRQAIQLGLQNNLGLLLRKEAMKSARGREWLELRNLLPNISTGASIHRVKDNLATTGITLPGIPPVVGPFSYYDLRITLSQRLFDLEAINRSRAAALDTSAEELSEKDARELVVVAVGATYLQALAGQARVETVRSQMATARAILDRAVALHREGVSPGIDELRARVELLTRNQQLIVAENELAKEQLNLVRLIGVPVEQAIELTDRAPFEPVTPVTFDSLCSQALASRRDYRMSEDLVKAAEASHLAARAQRLPSLVLDADYGIAGLNPSSMYESYHIVGSIRFPLFLGGKIHGDILTAEALVRQRKDERDDLRSRIEYEVRTALLDVEAAAKQVDVAKDTVELAELTLTQAQERFAAGINDNLEVVQAQQSVAAAHEALIAALYRHNLSKLLLARATGVAEEGAAGGGK